MTWPDNPDSGWAAYQRPRTSAGKPRTLHGELYLFGSLAIVAVGDSLIIAHMSWRSHDIHKPGRSP